MEQRHNGTIPFIPLHCHSRPISSISLQFSSLHSLPIPPHPSPSPLTINLPNPIPPLKPTPPKNPPIPSPNHHKERVHIYKTNWDFKDMDTNTEGAFTPYVPTRDDLDAWLVHWRGGLCWERGDWEGGCGWGKMGEGVGDGWMRGGEGWGE